MNAAIALAGILATLVMGGFLIAGIRKSKLNADSVTLYRVRRYARLAFTAALVALALELFDFDVWSLPDLASAVLTGANSLVVGQRLKTRLRHESVMARDAAREFDLPWVGGDPR